MVWLRQYPTQEVLGFLFGVSDSAALRAVARCLPLLEQAGRDTMRMPDPGRGRRKTLPRLIADTPGLAVLVDTFEQPAQRPRRRQRAYYSGKKKRHTLKSQVAVDEESGRFAHVGPSRPGPWADLKVLKRSGLRRALPAGVGVIGDLAYVGVAGWHPRGLGATPRRKPPGRDRPPEDRRYNRAFAGGGSGWSTRSAGCGGSRPSPRWTGTTAAAHRAGAGGGRAGQPHPRSEVEDGSP